MKIIKRLLISTIIGYACVSSRANTTDTAMQGLTQALHQLAEEGFLDYAMSGGMDVSTFWWNLDDELFRKKVFALGDNNFTKLMTELKIWHGGTPLMLVISEGKKQVSQGHDPHLIREFWNRIKKLPKGKVLQILNADYIHEKFSAWLERDDHRKLVPQDIMQEMDALLKEV